MEVIKLTPDNQSQVIAAAVKVLQSGGLVVYPTETTYGIGADCENPDAIQRLLSYKSNRGGKPLSVAVTDINMAEKYVSLNDTAKNVYHTFLPGPVTVISRSKGLSALGVASSSGSLGIRIPAYPFVIELVQKFGRGITATGANASYRKRPYKIADIFENISEKQKKLIGLIIDAGELPHNDPSTVIDTSIDDIKVSRRGPVSFKSSEIFDTENAEGTLQVAANLVKQYRSKLTYVPLVFALTGEMGAGKTQFAKGIAEGLKVAQTVTSPTFSIENEYQFVSEDRPGVFVHIDTWRIESAEEFDHLGIEQLIGKRAVIAIEWADRFTQEIQGLSNQSVLVWVNLRGSGDHREIKINHPNP